MFAVSGLIFPKVPEVGGYLKGKRKCELLTLFMYVFTFIAKCIRWDKCTSNLEMFVLMNLSSTCWPEKELQQLHLSHLLFLCILQLEMEKMTKVSTISGRTMFCHLDAPANAISVCRDATQVLYFLWLFTWLFKCSPFQREALLLWI